MEKYEAYKLTVKRWEHEFKNFNKRIPSKYDIKDAPLSVKQAYKMYHKMKTDFLTQSLSDVLDDEPSQMSQVANTSISISELLDPRNNLPKIYKNSDAVVLGQSNNDSQEFKATDHLTINDTTWGKQLNKPKPKEKTENIETHVLNRKMSLNFEPSSKTLRNPKKCLSKFKSSFNLSTITPVKSTDRDTLPDLETILTSKSRSHQNIKADIKIPYPSTSTKTMPSIDIGWLDRNTPSAGNDLGQSTSIASAASNFGLSNLNVTSSSLRGFSNLKSNVDCLLLNKSDHEVVGNSDDDSVLDYSLLPVAKKRRLSEETSYNKIGEAKELLKNTTKQDLALIDDEDKVAQHGVVKTKEDLNQKELPHSSMSRQPSMMNQFKESIPKCNKKTIKLLTESKHTNPTLANEVGTIDHEKGEEKNFLNDSDIKNFKTIPRASMKELRTTERLFDDYIRQHDLQSSVTKTPKVVDSATEAKKEAFMKKVKTGMLNENYRRMNLKKKIFVRGKKSFSISKHKKAVWKSKKVAALSGPEMDMRGCDGGALKCFNCDGTGHFAQNCKQKGDNLLPIDAEVEDESPFPTLEEATQLANDKKIEVHSSKVSSIAITSDIWKKINDEDVKVEGTNKENQNGNPERAGCADAKQTYIGQRIPQDFLKKSGLLELSVAKKDKVYPVFELNPDGSLPPTPEDVFYALKRFGHEDFRNGQEQAIMRILCGKSTLVTLSTGSGKSLCYQLPAYIYRKKSQCITLVISPLVSLMEDQIHGIPEFINAQCLHTNQTQKQREKTMEAIKSGRVEILLISPEALVSGEKSTGFGSLLHQLPPIAFACIDEAHCVSQWSHNFRPSYLMICRVLREKLGVKAVLGLTATATLQTRVSIISHLEIPDGLEGIISDTPLPDNLTLTISQDENRDKALLTLLRGERFGELRSVIIYCTRRDECERVAGILRTCIQEPNELGPEKSKKRKRVSWSAEAYHAGLPGSRRRTIQSAFMNGDLRIVVATIAFGMGINKSDIRGVIHYNLPKSFESYVQEVGRAGRDGLPADGHVFLDSRGSDLSELRRHIYSNSIDRHVVRKLLKRIFIPCSCSQHLQILDTPKIQKEPEKIDIDAFNGSADVSKSAFEVTNTRNCPGHEVCFSIDETVQALDIPEENISTLLCYLELHEQRYIKVLGNAYTKCKVFSYGGPKHLKLVARTCPPLAMAIALDLKNRDEYNPHNLNSLEFCVIDVASAMGWDSGVVKHQLKQLEWTTVKGTKKRSSITVSYSDLGFRIRSPGDLTNEELDTALDSLEMRTSSQEQTQLIQLQIIFNTFKSLSYSTIMSCSSKDFSNDSSQKLKVAIRSYFQTNLPMNVEIAEESGATDDREIVSDIRQMIGMYPDNNFSGRALARLFHGISSPCYPAVIWGRCKYWRAHINVNFSRIVALSNAELVNMRRFE